MATPATVPHRLVFPARQKVELEPFTMTEPAAGQVLIQAEVTLLSTGTETIVYNRKFDSGTHWDRWVQYPFYPGYAAAGRVVAAGAGVTRVAAGDRVIWRGGHASHAMVNAEAVFPVPPEVALTDAVWFALAKIAGHGVRAARIALGETVAIVGAGPIGQMALRWALLAGAGRVVCVDVAEPRLRLAATAGAEVVNATADIAGAVVANVLGAAPQVVIDSTGNAAVLHAILGWVATEGRVVLLGDTGSPGSQTLTGDVVTRGLTLVGAHDSRDSSQWNNAVAAGCFLEAVRTRRFPLDGMNTHRFAPRDGLRAYELATNDRVTTMGLLIDWTNPNPQS